MSRRHSRNIIVSSISMILLEDDDMVASLAEATNTRADGKEQLNFAFSIAEGRRRISGWTAPKWAVVRVHQLREGILAYRHDVGLWVFFLRQQWS